MNKTNFQDFSKTSGIFFPPRIFPGLVITILKFQDLSRFSMTGGTPFRKPADVPDENMTSAFLPLCKQVSG